MIPKQRAPRLRAVGNGPHGQVLALFALILVALLAVSALAVDYGGWLLARRGFQNVADAAALAGASQLSSADPDPCVTDTGVSGKQSGEMCAKQAAWQSIKSALGFTVLDPATQVTHDPSVAYQEHGYKIWVGSPPSETGSAYPGDGHYPDNPMAVFVWIEQNQSSGLGTIVRPAGTKVSAWSTAGRVSQSYAIVALCKQNGPGKSCLAQNVDIKVDGGSQVIVPTGDVGANTWTSTNGSNDYIALGSDSSSYEGNFDSCWNSSNCHLVGWVDPPGSATGGDRQAIPLGPEIVDPAYPVTGNAVSATLNPWQCGGSGAIASAPGTGPMTADANAPRLLESADLVLAAAVRPAPSGPIGFAATTATIQGKVVDSGGTGINGVTVSVPGYASVTTSGNGSSKGSYTISGLALSPYIVTADGFAVTYGTGTTSVNANSASTFTAANIVLAKVNQITGTVKDTSGNVLSGATVVVSRAGETHTLTTASDGTYTTNVNTAAVSYSIAASLSGYNPGSTSQNSTAGVRVTAPLISLAPQPGTITGTVRDSVTSSPISGATVTVTSGGGSPNPTTTSALGVYTITSVAAGSRTVQVTAAGYVATSATGTVPAGGTLTRDFSLGASGGISGTVTDSLTNAGISGVTVSAGTYTTATLADGTYSLTGVTPGTYTVTFAKTGYTTGTTNNVVVSSGGTATANKVLVSTSGTLAGTVTDSMYGVPVSGATVTVNGQTGTTDTSGHYSIPGVTAAKYTVSAAALGYFDFSQNNVTIAAGAITTLNFTMGPSTCTKQGNSYNGSWTMCQNGATLDICGNYVPSSPSGGAASTAADVTCSRFDRANRITAGTYKDISVPAGHCAWIDPIPDTLSSGQIPGVLHITGNLQLANNAVLFGDGVTIVMDSGSQLLVGNSSLFVLNFASVYNTATGTCDLSSASTVFAGPRCFRTHPGAASFTTTSTGYYDGNDYSYGAWTTTGKGTWSKSSFSWPVCGTHASVTWDQTYPSCINRAAIGMTFYLRPGSSYETKRFAQAGAWGFLFMGVLYGPKDNINLGGQGAQASAGQIVSWTLEYHGGTSIYQRYSGIKVDGPPYLQEPTLGQ